MAANTVGRSYTHTSAQCSPASVGLAQAHPNYPISDLLTDRWTKPIVTPLHTSVCGVKTTHTMILTSRVFVSTTKIWQMNTDVLMISLVPRFSIIANVVKLLCRMTSGGCLKDVWRCGTFGSFLNSRSTCNTRLLCRCWTPVRDSACFS